MFPFRIPLSLFGWSTEIGPYGLFLFLAILTALAGSLWFATKKGFPARKTLILLTSMCLAALVGARLLNAFVNLPAYLQEPSKLWAPNAEGFSLYGGILLAVITGYWLSRRLQIASLKMADTLIPFLGISIAIMRVGCFLNGCCFGKTTDSPWGVTFPFLSPAHLYQITHGGNFLQVNPVHPTQIYELIAALLLSAFCFYLLRKKLPTGTVALTFLSGFSLFRLFNYFLRVNPETFSAPEYFYPLLYLTLFSTGLIMIARKHHAEKRQIPALA